MRNSLTVVESCATETIHDLHTSSLCYPCALSDFVLKPLCVPCEIPCVLCEKQK